MQRINQMEPWLGKEEQDAVLEYLKSGGWLTEFKKSRDFEKAIADYTGAKYVSVVANGTLSLVAALLALNLSRDDEVIVPNYTMIASANAVILAGLKPVLVDIDKKNLCLNLEDVKKVITPKTKAVMIVSINGRAPNMQEFADFCKQNNLFLIEDAAQSLGSFQNGKHLGTFGDIGSFSFSMPKIITTGQGGALVTDNEELYKRILKIKDFGREKAGVDLHETMGYNFKFTDLQAVIGVEQMKKLAFRVERKKEIFNLYKDLLKDVPGVHFIETDTKDVSPWFIDILVDKNVRKDLIAFLESKNVGSRIFYPPIHTQKPYQWVKGDFDNSVEISEKGLWLPSASFLKDEDIKYVCDSIKEFFSK